MPSLEEIEYPAFPSGGGAAWWWCWVVVCGLCFLHLCPCGGEQRRNSLPPQVDAPLFKKCRQETSTILPSHRCSRMRLSGKTKRSVHGCGICQAPDSCVCVFRMIARVPQTSDHSSLTPCPTLLHSFPSSMRLSSLILSLVAPSASHSAGSLRRQHGPPREEAQGSRKAL